MNSKKDIRSLGELKIIKKIDEKILEKTNKRLIHDDSFFFTIQKENFQASLVLNSDMLVSTTDTPKEMSFYQIGRKSVLMNISDLMVKGVEPRAIIVSMGLPEDMGINIFNQLIDGIIDYCKKWKLEYIGGDINKTKELIISPTVFGFKKRSDTIFRKGLQKGDVLAINNKFGLTGVGFDILLIREGALDSFPRYKRSILSVLEPADPGNEGFILANNGLATSSIDSSDGLIKSLRDLMFSNPHLGFEIMDNGDLIDEEALNYSEEFNVPLEQLVFEGGEEFIQIFTIDTNNFEKAQRKVKERGGQLFKIGRVISEEKIYFRKSNIKLELKSHGFEHFI